MQEKRPLPPDVLVCGATIRLLALETTKSKWSTILIGSRPGRYIIVEMPRIGGAPVKLDDGARWAVNFVNKGVVYSFQTEILGYTYRIAPLLFLSYPREAEISNLRNEKRYPVNIPSVSKIILPPPDSSDSSEKARWQLNLFPAAAGSQITDPTAAHFPGLDTEGSVPPSPEGEVSTLVVDLSEGGFMMVSPEHFPPEATVESSFKLPDSLTIAGIQAVVRTCRGRPGGYLAGLSFTQSNTPETVDKIVNFIKSIENIPLRL